jgi:hypothetical protein
MSNSWTRLTREQQDACSAAARLVEDADMRFVFMMFGRDGVGAVISNVEPADAAPMIEQALKAAKAGVAADDILDGRRLQ